MTEPTTGGDCPTGCNREVLPGHLMCGLCWGEVPNHLQRQVYRTWRAYSKFRGIAQSPQRRQARLDYQAARDAAIASVS